MAAPSRVWFAIILCGVLVSGCRTERREEATTSAIGSPAVGQGDQQYSQPCRIDLAPMGDGRLGVLRVGMTLAELRSICPAVSFRQGTDEEGGPITSFSLPVSDRDTVFGDLEPSHVLRSFSIVFAGPRTVDGIAVGSTYRDVRSKYQRLGAGDNEGRVYVWPEPDRGLSFALGVDHDSLRLGWREAPSLIPDSTHVIELFIRAKVR